MTIDCVFNYIKKLVFTLCARVTALWLYSFKRPYLFEMQTEVLTGKKSTVFWICFEIHSLTQNRMETNETRLQNADYC